MGLTKRRIWWTRWTMTLQLRKKIIAFLELYCKERMLERKLSISMKCLRNFFLRFFYIFQHKLLWRFFSSFG